MSPVTISQNVNHIEYVEEVSVLLACKERRRHPSKMEQGGPDKRKSKMSFPIMSQMSLCTLGTNYLTNLNVISARWYSVSVWSLQNYLIKVNHERRNCPPSLLKISQFTVRTDFVMMWIEWTPENCHNVRLLKFMSREIPVLCRLTCCDAVQT